MHIEILVEDSSGKKLLQSLLPRMVGLHGQPHTWRVLSYKGVGRIPKNMSARSDPAKRILLDQLPRLLQGYGRTRGIDAVVVVIDTDKRDCKVLLKDLQAVASACDPAPNTIFRLAIEEVEAWYFGDQTALLGAYPRARQDVLKKYEQDSLCDTWELLADAIHPGGRAAVKRAGWPLSGQLKHEWAEKIGPLLDVENNQSPSFGKLRDGFYRLTRRN